jgi:hypothetical protein
MPVRSGRSSFDAGNASALPLLRMRSGEVDALKAATSPDVSVALILSKGAFWAPASKDEGGAHAVPSESTHLSSFDVGDACASPLLRLRSEGVRH